MQVKVKARLHDFAETFLLCPQERQNSHLSGRADVHHINSDRYRLRPSSLFFQWDEYRRMRRLKFYMHDLHPSILPTNLFSRPWTSLYLYRHDELMTALPQPLIPELLLK